MIRIRRLDVTVTTSADMTLVKYHNREEIMKRRTFLGGTTGLSAAAAMDLALPLSSAEAAQTSSETPHVAPVASYPTGVGDRFSFDERWRFHRGDIEMPFPKTGETYDYTKAGAANGPAGVKYDDSGWRVLDLPHDFVVEEPFDQNANGDQGYHPKRVGWYRKSFTLPESDLGRYIELQLDGMATLATVWFNGNVVRHNWSGYDSAYIDLTPFAHFGDKPNVVAVRVDSSALQGWWGEGGGIYRHTWLVKRSPIHIVTDGVYAHPRKQPDGSWLVPVEATVRNIGEKPAQAEVRSILFDPAGRPVAQGRGMVAVNPLGEAVATVALPLVSPLLWSVEEPHLYEVQTSVLVDGNQVDRLSTTAGFRTIRFDPNEGFFLNEKHVEIQGTCNHQDHAGVGIALPDSIIEYRLRKLKELGCNALRMSHNAPNRELLDIADRLGLMVMDENRLFNPSPDYMAMLQWLVRRDRNHPSIILWSVFNEEPLQGTREGYEMVRRMSAAVKELDTTRPVTAAMNGGMDKPISVADAVDVVGFNYSIPLYDKYHAAHPDKPLISSEDTSSVMTRGEYAKDDARHVIDSYDDQPPSWAATHRVAWKAIATRPFLAGGFVWTGFDYRGEPTPYRWPTASSNFGIMDTCGFPKAAYYMRQAMWLKDRPVLSLIPHWNWPGKEGQPIKVRAMSNAETVELRLNGRSLGTQPVDRFEMNDWDVPYQPGRLEVVARSGGRVVATYAVETTGAPVRLKLTPDRTALDGDGRDAVPFTIEALDSRGRHVPTANLPIQFAVAGGKIIGVGNGDPNSHEPDKATARSLYNGYAQVIVQSEKGGTGTLMLRATSPGLTAATASLRVRSVPPVPSVV
jgi:beta-galactosidase